MINKIKNNNSLYRVTICNIISIYREFRNIRENIIYEKLNNYFKWLEGQNKITCLNITIVAKKLLEDKEIRLQLLKEDNTELYILLNKAINNLDSDYLDNDKILLKQENLFIDSSKKRKLNEKNIIKFINKELFSTNLIYKDLIFEIINNCEFFKEEINLYILKDCNLFINKLNYYLVIFGNFLNGNREDLFKCSFDILSSKTFINKKHININEIEFDTKSFLFEIIECALKKINKIYYIKTVKLCFSNNYSNSAFIRKNNHMKLINILENILSIEDKIFMLKLINLTDKEIYDNKNLKNIELLINSLTKSEKIIVNAQNISCKKNLICESINYMQNYLEKHKIEVIKLENYFDVTNLNKRIFLQLCIRYNNFNYNFLVKKLNNKIMWVVKLKNKEVYQIQMYLKDDFKHMIQAVYEDY